MLAVVAVTVAVTVQLLRQKWLITKMNSMEVAVTVQLLLYQKLGKFAMEIINKWLITETQWLIMD